MRRVNVLAVVLSLVAMTGLGNPVQAQAPVAGATVFEGARVIVGDGSAIENATIVVDGARIVAGGPGRGRAGARRGRRASAWRARPSCRRSSIHTCI